MDKKTKTQDSLKGIVVSLVSTLISQLIAYVCSPKKDLRLNGISFGLILFQWAMFIFSSYAFDFPTEKYYDLSGGISCVITLILVFLFVAYQSTKNLILSLLGIIWSSRLSIFLFLRIKKTMVDERFNNLKSNKFLFLMSWTLQGLWIFVCITPILRSLLYSDGKLSLINKVGLAIWCIGFLIEIVADHQKSVFKGAESNKDRFISTGLWSISRHPNYFGEILIWIGVAIASLNELKLKEFALNAISPVFVALLLIFVSGIPLLEKKYDEKYSNDEKYQKYKAYTPVLIPFIGRAGDAAF